LKFIFFHIDNLLFLLNVKWFKYRALGILKYQSIIPLYILCESRVGRL